MNKILISDLHLTDSARDVYRWDIFDWLERQVDKYRVKAVYILGDLTEKKDKHPSSVVNGLMNALGSLSLHCEIVILKGNHDFIDEDNPFFGFVNMHPRIQFIREPFGYDSGEKQGELFLPYTDTPEHDWYEIHFDSYHTVYMHQMVKGATFSNQHVTGEGVDGVKLKCDMQAKIFSGHIHVPQTMTEGITYVGAPYSVYFGDHYEGRAMLMKDNGKCVDLEPEFPRLWGVKIESIEDLNEHKIAPTDMLKVEINLPRSETHAYRDICNDVKEWCRKFDVRLCGIKVKVMGRETRTRRRRRAVMGTSNVDILRRFSEREKLGREQIEKGEELIE
jgi:DNA repair exonuclease SbcCD nuclease subunit